MAQKTLIQNIASACGARKRCAERDASAMVQRWDRLLKCMSEALPSGAGFDNGTRINVELSGDDVVVLETSFHHMNDQGSYIGWTDHTVTIQPSFNSVTMQINKHNQNTIKDYIAEVFDHCLTQEYTPEPL